MAETLGKVWLQFTNQKQWKEYLKNLVKTNDKALTKSIMVIYGNQTREEQSAGTSFEENAIGFSRNDCKLMSRYAEMIKSGCELSSGQLSISRIIMPKYWKQLMVVSKKNMEVSNG